MLKGRRRTLCLSRSSLLRGADMMTRRTEEGALKCALRAFLREEWRATGFALALAVPIYS